MADVNIVIAAQDMASSVLKGVAATGRIMAATMNGAASSVVTSTKAMAAGFMSLQVSLGPLLAVMFTLQAAFAVFRFARDSVLAFVEAGSPAGVALGQSFKMVEAAMQSLMKVVGAVLAPAVQAGAEIFMVLVQVITQSLSPAIGGMGSVFESLKPYIEGFKIGMIAAITGIEVGLTNFSSVFSIVAQTLQLKMVQVALAIGTFFLETAPQAIFDFVMFIGNTIPKVPKIMYDSFVTAFNAIQNVLLGLQSKVSEIFTQIWDFITSGGRSALTATFSDLAMTAANQINAIQDEAARQIGSLALGEGLATNLLDGLQSQEQALQSSISDTASDLAGTFNSTFQQRLSALQGPALPDTAEPKAEETAKKLTGGLTAVADSQAAIAQQLSATESRLLTRGPSEGPMQSVAQASQKTAEAAEKTSQSSDRMVELLEQLLARNFIVAEAV